MKLELKELSPYLPYGIRVTASFGEKIIDNTFIVSPDFQVDNVNVLSLESILEEDGHKMVLRPLSDLEKPIPYRYQRVSMSNEISKKHAFKFLGVLFDSSST